MSSKRMPEDKTESRGIVASVHPLASQAGIEVLRKGGNAVDAAITTALTMHVVAPAWSTLGGGAFIMVYLHNTGRAVFIDAREVAPKKASPGVFTMGHRASGVPGVLSGFCLALDNYGTISIKQALQPAIKYARDGYEVNRRLAQLFVSNERGGFVEKVNKFEAIGKMFLKDGHPYKLGDKIICNDLANTLIKIASDGPQVFYEGEVAEAIAEDMKKNEGFTTKEDLSDYKSIIRKPVVGEYRGYEIISAPPPGGGCTIIEALNILENFELKNFRHNTSKSIHLISESLKYALNDKNLFIADPEFADVSIAKITSKAYAAEIAGKINLKKTSTVDSASKDRGHVSCSGNDCTKGDTAHLTVIDRDRNVVSITDSINDFFGSGIVIENTGILMNNTMDDFNQEQGDNNSIEGGKRPASCMSPTVVLKSGKPFLSVGSAGGPRIISAVLQVIINVIDFDMGLGAAVEAPRFHCQGGEIYVEHSISKKVRKELIKKGQEICQRDEWWFVGGVQAALLDPRTNKIYGAADPRRDGIAIEE